MEQLLKKLGINGNQSQEEILHELEKKQMEFLDRLDSVTDESRKEELNSDLKEIEGAISSLSWVMKRQESGIALDESETGAIARDEETPVSSGDTRTAQVSGGNAAGDGDERQAQIENLLDEARGYLFGENGYEEDHARGFQKTLEAAELGDPFAQYALACLYRDGKGTPQDMGKFMEWLETAANNGSIAAQSMMGDMYYEGNGVLMDYQKAAEWYLKAALYGEPSALNNLGWMYQNGTGVPVSLEKAVEYYRKAVESAEESGGKEQILDTALRNLLAVGDEEWYANHKLNQVKRRYEEDQITLEGLPGQEGTPGSRSREEMEALLERNRLSTPLGLRYLVLGEELETDGKYRAALPFLMEAYEEGISAAAVGIGWIYVNGNDTFPANPAEGISWWEKGASQGDLKCLENLGYAYHDGKGVQTDYGLAAKWLQKAADGGSAKAMFSLAWMYQDGAGVPRSPRDCFRMMKKAADAGEIRAYNDLATFYYQGVGTAKDFDMAVIYFEKAYEAGDPNGKNNLEAIGMGMNARRVEEKLKRKALKEELRGKANAIAAEIQGGDALEEKAQEYTRLGGPENEMMAELLQDMAAERGNAEAQYLTGFRRLSANYQDEGAADLIKKAAEQGNLEALCRVAEWHLGVGIHGCPGDKEKAIELLEQAAAGGSMRAKEQLKKLKPFESVGKKLSGLFGRK